MPAGLGGRRNLAVGRRRQGRLRFCWYQSDNLTDHDQIYQGPHALLWAHGRNWCYPVTFPSPQIEEHQPILSLISNSQESPLKAVRLEIDAGSEELSRRRGQDIAGSLAAKGVGLGPGGYTLRVRYGVADSGDTLQRGSQKIPIPMVVASWQLLDPKGKEVWSEVAPGGYWNPRQSQYKKRAPTGDHQGQIQYFEFPSGDARAAIVQEILTLDSFFTSRAPESVLGRLTKPVGKSDIKLPARLKIARPTRDEMQTPVGREWIKQAARVGMAAELALPEQCGRPLKVAYSADGTSIGVVAVVGQSLCLLTYDRTGGKWRSATPMIKEGSQFAVSPSLDKFAFSSQGVIVVGEVGDPSSRVALPQRLQGEVQLHRIALSANGKYLSRVLGSSLSEYPLRAREKIS